MSRCHSINSETGSNANPCFGEKLRSADSDPIRNHLATNPSRRKRRKVSRLSYWLLAHRGLTLLELVVALAVLAVLSTVAVQALDPIADQARYESTRRVLDELRDVTVGSSTAKQANGLRIVSGFIAHTGTLPSDLDDFLSLPVGLAGQSVQSFDSDRDTVDDVTLTSGWAGPYLNLGAGQTAVVDGWGQSPLIDPDGGVFDFTSLGSDNDSVVPESGYRADLSVTIQSDEYLSTVVCRLFEIDGITGTRIDPSPGVTEQLGVLFYGVNLAGGTTGAIEEVLLPVAAAGTFEASQANMVHGAAAARGILWTDTDLDQELDALETVSKKSYVHYFTVVGEADLRIEMELR